MSIPIRDSEPPSCRSRRIVTIRVFCGAFGLGIVMRKVVLTAFVIFGIAERVVAGDLSDRFKNDFDGTLAPALGIPSVVSPNLDVPAAADPVPFVAAKPRPRPRHDISPNAAPPAARVPTAEPAIGHLKTDHHVATGREGDRAHALLATAGHKFHVLMDWFGELWHGPNHTGSER